MNLKALLEKQKKLDEVIFKNSGIEEYPYINMKVALLVELGELANEVQSFKHWKKNKNVNRDRVLDEFADCMHFALSLENEFNQMEKELIDNPDLFNEGYEISTGNKDEYKTDEYNTCCLLVAYENISKEEDYLMAIISTGIWLGFTLEEMEQAYLNKHEINYKRQVEGY